MVYVYRCRCFLSIVAISAAFLGANIPQFSASVKYKRLPSRSRRLEIGVVNSDEYASAVLAVKPPRSPFLIGADDLQNIISTLVSTKEMVETARVLIRDETTLKEGQDMIEEANAMFSEVKDQIITQRDYQKQQIEQSSGGGGDPRSLLRDTKSDYDVQQAREDEKRGLVLTRKLYETMISFPECVELFFSDCLAIINEALESLGLSSIEVIVHEKRNADQEGYNKVVIVTNELADRVKGRSGDGIVEYPFMWNDALVGYMKLGVDGKWNCLNKTPEDCCAHIKDSALNPDIHGKMLECHIFVPYGGVGNPRRNDRILIKLSPDGRVHEAPMIQ